METIGGEPSELVGSVDSIQSPVGNALRFDGTSGEILAAPVSLLSRTGATLGISAWIELNTYPWNRVPILDQCDAEGGFFFGFDAVGHLLIKRGQAQQTWISKNSVPLRKWVLVAAGVGPGKVSFRVDGEEISADQAAADLPATICVAPGDLRMGHARSPLLPAPEKFIHPLFPIEFSLDGALGAVTIADRPFTAEEIKAVLQRANAGRLKPMPWPRFPRWQGGKGSFGAYYASLKYDPEWDRRRRVAPDSDVVVRFEDSPAQLIFWQGNNYVPAWVTENNRWYTDEFMETYGKEHCPYGEDCEPMSDKQVRYSHVQILESTPARAVIHWRYALSEVEQYAIADAPNLDAWGDWADEYWTVYPDAVAVRRSVLWSAAPEREKTEFQESIVLVPPGETPEDNLHLDALTFGNLRGETQTYAWQQKVGQGLSLPKGPKAFTEPKDAVIQWVNLRSEWKPFQVAWGRPVRFTAYNSEMSSSSFEWWNHWPVAQIPSSGRPALAADRAGHTSVSHIVWPVYQQDARTVTKILMDGLTNLPACELAPLAASWRNPVPADLADGTKIPYDPAQRAYVFPQGAISPARIQFHADREHPLFHPVFVIPGWDGTAEVQVLSGAAVAQARIGVVHNLDSTQMVIYLPVSASGDGVIEIRKK